MCAKSNPAAAIKRYGVDLGKNQKIKIITEKPRKGEKGKDNLNWECESNRMFTSPLGLEFPRALPTYNNNSGGPNYG